MRRLQCRSLSASEEITDYYYSTVWPASPLTRFAAPTPSPQFGVRAAANE
jgi:hypothetical protein